MEAQKIVLTELRAGSGFTLCAIADIFPTGSHQAPLRWIGLNSVGFDGFSSGSFDLHLFVFLFLAILAGSRGLKLYFVQQRGHFQI